MKISMIVACDTNGAIGYENKLLTHIPKDMKHFKEKTVGKYCIMGRKTYDSILKKNGEPLKDRVSLVLTSDTNKLETHDRMIAFDSFEGLKEYMYKVESEDTEFMVIGGEQIYNLFIKYAQTIYLTCINHRFEQVDSFFPIKEISEGTLEIKEVSTPQTSPEGYEYRFYTLGLFNFKKL